MGNPQPVGCFGLPVNAAHGGPMGPVVDIHQCPTNHGEVRCLAPSYAAMNRWIGNPQIPCYVHLPWFRASLALRPLSQRDLPATTLGRRWPESNQSGGEDGSVSLQH